MSNSLQRILSGMAETLSAAAIPEIKDPAARSQVYGVINLLRNLVVRAEWSSSLLIEQVEAQERSLQDFAGIAEAAGFAEADANERLGAAAAFSAKRLLALRDANDLRAAAIARWLEANQENMDAEQIRRIELWLLAYSTSQLAVEARYPVQMNTGAMTGS